MVTLSQQLKLLLGKTLVLSFLLHLIVFNSFSFTLSTKFENRKPEFIFLGPILKKQNVSIMPSEKNNAFNYFTSDDLIHKTVQGSQKNPPDITVRKPFLRDSINPQHKTTLKPHLQMTEKSIEHKPNEPSPFEIDLPMAPYRSLRLQTP